MSILHTITRVREGSEAYIGRWRPWAWKPAAAPHITVVLLKLTQPQRWNPEDGCFHIYDYHFEMIVLQLKLCFSSTVLGKVVTPSRWAKLILPVPWVWILECEMRGASAINCRSFSQAHEGLLGGTCSLLHFPLLPIFKWHITLLYCCLYFPLHKPYHSQCWGRCLCYLLGIFSPIPSFGWLLFSFFNSAHMSPPPGGLRLGPLCPRDTVCPAVLPLYVFFQPQ